MVGFTLNSFRQYLAQCGYPEKVVLPRPCFRLVWNTVNPSCHFFIPFEHVRLDGMIIHPPDPVISTGGVLDLTESYINVECFRGVTE